MLYLCADPSAAQPAPLSQCLDTILLSPDAGACFDYLEEQGLLLGNGGFLLTLLCPRGGAGSAGPGELLCRCGQGFSGTSSPATCPGISHWRRCVRSAGLSAAVP